MRCDRRRSGRSIALRFALRRVMAGFDKPPAAAYDLEYGCPIMKRRLIPVEQAEARRVFGANLDYSRIWVYEGVAWPNWVACIGARLARRDPPGDNAITLGNRLFFPVSLRTSQAALESGVGRDFAWLIHELAHAWQYQHVGPRYLMRAIAAQVRLGPQAYDYGGEEGLRQAAGSGKGLLSFNPEQQADIARDIYLMALQGEVGEAWRPFDVQLKSLPPGG